MYYIEEEPFLYLIEKQNSNGQIRFEISRVAFIEY